MKTVILEKNDKRSIRKFKNLPFRLYKGNQYWVPPFPGEIEKVMFTMAHPFYAHSEADFIIVESEKDVLGRIAIIHNRNYCEFHKRPIAFFYYFESVDDSEVSNRLFQAAEDWSHARGLIEMIGPRGFLRSNGMGTLIEGYDQRPAMGIIYNHPYYPKLIEKAGFEKYFDHFSGYLDKHPDPVIHKAAQKVLARGNFKVLSFKSIEEIKKWIPNAEEVHQRAFEKNPDFYPSTPEEFSMMINNIIAVCDPKYIKLILHNDVIAGFVISYPDVSRALQATRGNLLPFGWLALLLEKILSRTIDLNAVGLLPEYQGLGGNVLLYSEIDKVTSNNRFTKGELVQVDERNFRSKSDMTTMGAHWSKTHRTYKKTI